MWPQAEVLERLGGIIGGQHGAAILLGEALDLQAPCCGGCQRSVARKAEQQSAALLLQDALEATIVARGPQPCVHQEVVVCPRDVGEPELDLAKAVANVRLI